MVVEAPAGCGKTHQGADFARDLAQGNDASRPLILTHTHAACSVFAERTKGTPTRVDIRTIDSVVAQLASAYHVGLGLRHDTALWVRERKNGHAELCLKVANLIGRHPMIARSLALRHRTVICDEHQDSSADQHAMVMALLDQGAQLRIFADPMQKIFKNTSLKGSHPPWEWDQLKGAAHEFVELEFPHRWKDGCPRLGEWTLNARKLLKSGGRIDLRSGVPDSVTIVFADNEAKKTFDYQLSKTDRKAVDAFEQKQPSLLILTRHNDTARSFCAFFNRRIPLWEGHMRSGLEKLVLTMAAKQGDGDALAAAVVAFMGDIGKGFSPSAFGDAFQQEVHDGCAKSRKGKRASIQELARFIVAEPDHRGVAKMLHRLAQLKDGHDAFGAIAMDCHREFWDAVRLGGFDSPDAGFVEITHRRAHTRPKPPARAISTIHKAKGLECGSVIVIPCDGTTLPEKLDARCLLYVALSRAKKRLMLVVSTTNPTPLFTV